MRYFSILIFLISQMTNAASAEDIAGSHDHPIITRHPGSVIEWYSIDNYRPYKVPIGPVTGYRKIDDWIETEGRVTRIYYALDGGARSDSEVYKNYQDALITAGFSILAEGLSPASDRGVGVGSRNGVKSCLPVTPGSILQVQSTRWDAARRHPVVAAPSWRVRNAPRVRHT